MAPVGQLVVPAQHHAHAAAAEMPELNPVENVWQFMRDNWLSNRVFKSYDDIVDHCCAPGTSSSISPGASCPSACANGRIGSDQWDLVLRVLGLLMYRELRGPPRFLAPVTALGRIEPPAEGFLCDLCEQSGRAVSSAPVHMCGAASRAPSSPARA